ncbi:MAG: hypothetical protein WA081_18440, partial [Desulfosalsimonadaceae bacterium]
FAKKSRREKGRWQSFQNPPKLIFAQLSPNSTETSGSGPHRNGHFTIDGPPARNQPDFTCKPIYK